MTRLEKSDSQLDAEAEARRRALELPKLEHGFDDPDAYDPPEFEPSGPPVGRVELTHLRWLIIDLRRAFSAETPGRIHQRQTSQSAGDELDDKGWAAYPDEGGLGPPFTAAMHRFLRTNVGRSARETWDLGPDPRSRPAMASVQNESERCHALHTSHLRPGYSLSLCAELMLQAGKFGQEPTDLAWLFELPLEQIESMLLNALRHGRTWRADTEQRLSREPGTPAPTPERRPWRPAA